jgi:hypothetical protein
VLDNISGLNHGSPVTGKTRNPGKAALIGGFSFFHLLPFRI